MRLVGCGIGAFGDEDRLRYGFELQTIESGDSTCEVEVE